ncbi:MAG: hypothetical protein K5876_02620 [Ruminiclostridium sp.]|nr:hypothetical protein [Ruminiclostridium sp.]
MKRLIFFIPLILALSACSAGGNTAAPPDMDISFSAEASVSYDGMDCTAQIRRIERDIWEFCITSPYPVEGLVISVRNDETKLKMYDMESTADIDGTAVSMARAIADAYEAAAENGTMIGSGYSASAVSGSPESGSCTVVFNEKREPVSISSDAGRLSVEFTKFAPLEREGEDEEDAVIIIE